MIYVYEQLYLRKGLQSEEGNIFDSQMRGSVTTLHFNIVVKHVYKRFELCYLKHGSSAVDCACCLYWLIDIERRRNFVNTRIMIEWW